MATLNFYGQPVVIGVDDKIKTGNIYNVTVKDPHNRHIQVHGLMKPTWWTRAEDEKYIWTEIFADSREEITKTLKFFSTYEGIEFSNMKVSPRFALTYEIEYEKTPQQSDEFLSTLFNNSAMTFNVHPASLPDSYNPETVYGNKVIENAPHVSDVAWDLQNVSTIETSRGYKFTAELFTIKQPLMMCLLYNERLRFHLKDPSAPATFKGVYLKPSRRQEVMNYRGENNIYCDGLLRA